MFVGRLRMSEREGMVMSDDNVMKTGRCRERLLVGRMRMSGLSEVVNENSMMTMGRWRVRLLVVLLRMSGGRS